MPISFKQYIDAAKKKLGVTQQSTPDPDRVLRSLIAKYTINNIFKTRVNVEYQAVDHGEKTTRVYNDKFATFVFDITPRSEKGFVTFFLNEKLVRGSFIISDVPSEVLVQKQDMRVRKLHNGYLGKDGRLYNWNLRDFNIIRDKKGNVSIVFTYKHDSPKDDNVSDKLTIKFKNQTAGLRFIQWLNAAASFDQQIRHMLSGNINQDALNDVYNTYFPNTTQEEINNFAQTNFIGDVIALKRGLW